MIFTSSLLRQLQRNLYLRNVRCEKIHLAVGVPLKWMDSLKGVISVYMLQNSEIRFVYKGRIFEVKLQVVVLCHNVMLRFGDSARI